MNNQFEYITSVGSERGKAVHAQISTDIKNGTVTPITSVFGSGFTADYPVKTAAISTTIEADAVKISEDSITVVEFKTGTFNVAAAKRQAVMYAFGIHRVTPRDFIHIIIIGVDANKIVRVDMTSDDMIKSYVADNANRVAVDKVNNPSTVTISARAMAKVIGVSHSSIGRTIRDTSSKTHIKVFVDTGAPVKVNSDSGQFNYAFTRDHIFNMVMFYGVYSSHRNATAQAAVVEVAANGIDAFISAHF